VNNLWIKLWTRTAARLRALAADDRGVTTEHVIWIAFLAALALTVTAIFGPKILAAARSVTFQ
jgi:hypothetical protein